jgi:nitrate/TMAO reductase-like tetraheme cytochrome c subunit
MLKRWIVFIALALSASGWWRSQAQEPSLATVEAQYKNNQCVACHGALHEPLQASSRFYEWQFSRHWKKGVACEACHGGNAAATDKAQAHAGVLPYANPQSRLYYKNQPETCGSCHKEVVNAFVQSAHYQKLKHIGIGASCTTCHEHMATQVIHAPSVLANQCARCHDTLDLMPARPEIPIFASNTLAAFNRTNSMMQWAHLLLANSQQRNLNVSAERADLLRAQQMLDSAKVDWHTFKLDNALRQRIDAAYNQVLKNRDELRKKLNIR